MNENMKGGLWLTPLGKVVLDNHSYEVFDTACDFKLANSKELKDGIKVEEFILRLMRGDVENESSSE